MNADPVQPIIRPTAPTVRRKRVVDVATLQTQRVAFVSKHKYVQGPYIHSGSKLDVSDQVVRDFVRSTRYVALRDRFWLRVAVFNAICSIAASLAKAPMPIMVMYGKVGMWAGLAWQHTLTADDDYQGIEHMGLSALIGFGEAFKAAEMDPALAKEMRFYGNVFIIEAVRLLTSRVRKVLRESPHYCLQGEEKAGMAPFPYRNYFKTTPIYLVAREGKAEHQDTEVDDMTAQDARDERTTVPYLSHLQWSRQSLLADPALLSDFARLGRQPYRGMLGSKRAIINVILSMPGHKRYGAPLLNRHFLQIWRAYRRLLDAHPSARPTERKHTGWSFVQDLVWYFDKMRQQPADQVTQLPSASRRFRFLEYSVWALDAQLTEVLKLHPEWAVSADPEQDEAGNLDELASAVIFQKPVFRRRTGSQEAQAHAENREPLDDEDLDADESE